MPKYIHNHPTTKLWQFHEYYLLKYLRHLLNEFMDRTNKYHSCEKQYKIVFNKIAYLTYIPEEMNFLTPEFCKKHQQILLEKDFNHYKQYFIYGYIQEKNNKKA